MNFIKTKFFSDKQGNTAITEFFVLKTSLGRNTINRDTVKNAIITNIIRV